GPIGSIITPPLVGLSKSKDLPFASSLCGACRDVCPVRINIPHVLLNLRSEWAAGRAVDERGKRRQPTLLERAAIKAWAFAMRHTRLYNFTVRLAARFQGPLLNDGKLQSLPFAFSGWTENRDFPPLAAKPFRALWREQEKP